MNSKGNYPKMAELFRVVNCCDFPRYVYIYIYRLHISYLYVYIYIYCYILHIYGYILHITYYIYIYIYIHIYIYIYIYICPSTINGFSHLADWFFFRKAKIIKGMWATWHFRSTRWAPSGQDTELPRSVGSCECEPFLPWSMFSIPDVHMSDRMTKNRRVSMISSKHRIFSWIIFDIQSW